MPKSIFVTLSICLGLIFFGGALNAAAQNVLPSIPAARVLPASPPIDKAGKLAWTFQQPRKDLMQKASVFLEGGTGYYINTDTRRLAQGLITPQEVGKTLPTLPEQFNEVFGGVPNPEVTLVGNYRLFEACQVHNCGTKAVLVTDASGTLVQAAGLLKQFGCTATIKTLRQPTNQMESQAHACEDGPTLTIFYQSAQTKNAALTEQIIEWAKVKVADFFNTARLPDKGRRLKVEINFVHGS